MQMNPAAAGGGSDLLPGVPRNLLHKFGRNTCEALFADPELVQHTWELMNPPRMRNSTMPVPHAAGRSRTMKQQPSAGYNAANKEEDTYQELSQIMRNNAFPGHNVTYRVGHNQTVHSAAVHAEAEVDAEDHVQFPIRKDDLKQWNEIVYLRKQMDKSMNSLNPTKSNPSDSGYKAPPSHSNQLVSGQTKPASGTTTTHTAAEVRNNKTENTGSGKAVRFQSPIEEPKNALARPNAVRLS